jgi:hypothetical protein
MTLNVAAVSSALVDAGTGLISLMFGGGNNPVSLGDFVFQGFEVPESITWGGAQRLVVHKFVGGGRTIDAMGRDDADITWSGIFLSSDASQRADSLDQLRVAGVPLALQFMGRQYSVLIASFQATHRRVNHVPYQIKCTVLADDTSYAAIASPTLLGQLTNDLNTALGFDVGAALTAAQTELATVAPIIAPLTALVPGSAAANSVLAGLSTTQSLLGAAQTAASGNIAGITTLGLAASNLLGAKTATQAVANSNTAAQALQTSSQAAAMSAFVSRMQVNAGGA